MGKYFSISNRLISVGLHAIAWVIVIIIPLYLNTAFGNGNLHRVYEFYVHTFSAGIIFYIGYLYLVPRFFLQERKMVYALILIALIIGTYFLSNLIEGYLPYDKAEYARFLEAMKCLSPNNEVAKPPFKVFSLFNHILSSVLVSGFAMGLGVMEKLKQNEKKQKELEKEKLNSELAFLKNQIGPHFFFNTLNNIYSLIGINTNEAQESVLKLSKLMRYLLYESEQGETNLSLEIDFMKNYVDLMKLRLNPRVDLQFSFPEKYPDYKVPPLLFVPFIENAFKHGISYREQSFIHLEMGITAEQVTFHIVNSVGNSSSKSDGQNSGIGLENVRKRLALLFPEKHTLLIKQEEKTFEVNLTIETKQRIS